MPTLQKRFASRRARSAPAGLDDAKHGGAAYAFDSSKQGSKSDEHKMSELESIGEEVSSLRDSETGTAADLDA